MGRFVFMVISQVGIENKQKSASGAQEFSLFMSDFPSKGYESGRRGECSILAFEARQEPTRKKRRRTVNAVCNKLCNFCVRLRSIVQKILSKTFSIKMHVWFYSERPTVFNRRFQNSEYISRKIIFEIDFCWPFLLLQKSGKFKFSMVDLCPLKRANFSNFPRCICNFDQVFYDLCHLTQCKTFFARNSPLIEANF